MHPTAFLADRARRRAMLILAALPICLSSCANGDVVSDDRAINNALLATLTAARAPICVDSTTYGEPLAVYRTMKVAPDAVRRLLHWSRPAPLTKGRVLTTHELVDNEMRDGRSMLPEARQDKDQLSLPVQAQLNALAEMALLVEPESGVFVHDSTAAPLARVRWWPFNLIDSRCPAIYTFSKPVIKRGIAFVTVTAAHQGSTYAFQKTAAGWSNVAKWSNWLY